MLLEFSQFVKFATRAAQHVATTSSLRRRVRLTLLTTIYSKCNELAPRPLRSSPWSRRSNLTQLLKTTKLQTHTTNTAVEGRGGQELSIYC